MQTQTAALVRARLEDRGLTLLPDTTTWINRFPIKSESSDREYIIAQRANLSEWGCSCPAWRTRRQCKHLRTVKPLLEAASK